MPRLRAGMAIARKSSVWIAFKCFLGKDCAAVTGGAGDHHLGVTACISNAQVAGRHGYRQKIICLGRGGGAAAIPVFDLFKVGTQSAEHIPALCVIKRRGSMERTSRIVGYFHNVLPRVPSFSLLIYET